MALPTERHLAVHSSSHSRLLLKAGPLSMIFDIETAFLRRIRAGATEIIRGVYVAVRDHEWRTLPVEVTMREKTERAASFQLVFDAAVRSEHVDYRWRGTVTGDDLGMVRYEMKGRALSDFLRNRIGFCLLHPVEGFAGAPCTVEHADGSTEEIVIPKPVSPQQPVFDIRALTHEIDDLRVEVRFEGDVFEIEDQRNWTDASFKTYCTPLERPTPVQVREGDTVEQAISIRLHGASRPSGTTRSSVTAHPSGTRRPTGTARRSGTTPSGTSHPSGTTPPGTAHPSLGGVYRSDGPVSLHIDDEASGRAPAIGAYFSGAEGAAGADAAEGAAGFPFDHLRVDVDASSDDLTERLASASAAAERLSTSLFVSVMLGDSDRLAAAVTSLDLPVSRWLVLRGDGLATTEDDIRAFRSALDTAAPVGGGSNAYFTQVNRHRPPFRLIDFVCFSVNPQVHAFDDLSLMETLPIHAELVENARKFSGGRPIAVSPVTLRPRYNPEAGGRSAPGAGYDPRQSMAFGAAWTAGSFIHLCHARAQLATFFDVGTIREPLAALLGCFLTWQGLDTRRVRSSDPERVLAVALESAPTSLLVVNLTPHDQKAVVAGAGTHDLAGAGTHDLAGAGTHDLVGAGTHDLGGARTHDLAPYGYTILEDVA